MNARQRLRHLHVLSLVMVLGASACSDSSGGGPGDEDAGADMITDAADAADAADAVDAADAADAADATDAAGDATDVIEPRPRACVVDAAAIAAAHRCVMDDDCPCGARCDLGQCIATCLEDRECGVDEACDRFGRCRSVEAIEANPIALRRPHGEGHVEVAESALRLNNAAQARAGRRMTLVAVGGQVSRARVVASEGVEVAVARPGTPSESLTYASELLLSESLAEGETVEVFVRPAADAGPAFDPETGEVEAGEAWTSEVSVHDASGAATTAVLATPQGAEVVAAGQPLAGVYEGVARVTRAGLTSASGGAQSPLAVDLSAPITATVYPAAGGRAVIVIEEPLGLLLRGGRVVGEVVLGDGSAPHVTLPAQDALPELPVAGVTSHVVARFEAGALTSDPTSAQWEGDLSFGLGVRYEGISGSAFAPRVRWQVGLMRRAGLPPDATAPAPDAAVQVAYDTQARRFSPFPWEGAFLDAIDTGDPLAVDDSGGGVYWEDTTATTLEACAPRAINGHLVTSLVFGAWMPEVHELLGIPIPEAVRFELFSYRLFYGSALEVERLDELIDGQVSSAELPSVDHPLTVPLLSGLSLPPLTGTGDFYMMTFGLELDPPLSGYALPDGTPLAGAMPCAYDISAWPASVSPVSGLTDATLTLPGAAFDACDYAQRLTGCQVIDVRHMPEAARPAPVVSLGFTTAEIIQQGGETEIFPTDTVFPVDPLQGGVVSHVCLLPEYGEHCIERARCASSAASTMEVVGPLGARLHPISGDLVCEAGGRSFAMPFDDAGLDFDALPGACAADLAALHGPAPAVSGASAEARLASMGWDEARACLHPARFLTTLAMSSARARSQVYPVTPSPWTDHVVGSAITARLLQRWLELHAFGAGEAEQGALVIDPGAGDSALVEQEAALRASVDGWRLLLTPRVGTALVNLRSDALREADYREPFGPFVDPGAAPHQSIEEGLLTTMIETLAVQTELAFTITERRALAGAVAVPEPVTDLLQTALVVEALVRGLRERAVSAAPGVAPDWSSALDRAFARYLEARQRLNLMVSTLVKGTNPLGIEDEDLPLYFRELQTDAGSRFAAISAHIVGESAADIDAWAPTLVRAAHDAFAAARAATREEAQRQINVENDQASVDLRVSVATYDFGAALEDLCGAEAFPGLVPDQIPGSLTEDFSMETCWFNADDPSCYLPEPSPPEPRSAEEIAFNRAANSVCRASLSVAVDDERWRACDDHLASLGIPADLRCGPLPGLRFPTRVMEILQDRIIHQWDGLPLESAILQLLPTLPVSALVTPVLPRDRNPCVNDQAPGLARLMPEVEHDLVSGVTLLRCAPISDYTGPEIVLELTNEGAEVINEPDALGAFKSTSICEALFPVEPPRDTSLQLEGLPSRCFRGSLGNAAVGLRAMTSEIEVARSALDDMLREYEISMTSCYRLQAGNAALAATLESFTATQAKLGFLRAQADAAATVAGGAADCADSIAGVTNPATGAAAGTACAARAVEATANIVSIALDTRMEQLTLQHEQTMALIEASTDEDRCFIEAELALVGAQTASLNIRQAIEEMSTDYVAFRQEIEQAKLSIERGFGDIDTAAATGIRVIGPDPWLRRDIERYEDSMRLARRATYLAARAVEYEFQASLAARGAALEATHPDALQGALQDLREVIATGNVEGARPAELTEVFSLRRHLLQLADRSGLADSEQNLTDVERFQLLLQNPAFEVYEDGVLVGRQIPFEIAPLAALGLGSVAGVPVVSDSSCAERLWSVNAAFMGDEARMFRGVAPQANIEIRKRNTFYSNWCDPVAHEAPFQVASTRPGRNLFAEPGLGEGISGLGGAAPAERFAKARIQAQFNIAPGDFIDDAYTDGASTELAARALFGDYTLFIPETSLAPVNAQGEATGDGLLLNGVEDILIRLDYLSVAR